jgi:uncharacterized protein with HEPN domain
MHDKKLITEILEQIYDATGKVLKRFEPIKSVNDFTDSEAGMEKLDAICMQLIAIGEALKNLDKITNDSLLPNYPQIDWKKVKGMRDIISHHYFDIDAEAIYAVCADHIKVLSQVINKISEDVKKDKYDQL